MSAAHKDDQVIDLGSEKYSDYHSAILLASVALTAFAGAAAAEVSFSGSATLGYNDDNGRLANNATFGDHNGFYSDLNVDVALSATLDNGITVSASAAKAAKPITALDKTTASAKRWLDDEALVRSEKKARLKAAREDRDKGDYR